MPSNRNGLNSRQQEAVDYVHGPLLVLAGAGSGKTRVITTKIARLIERGQVSASRIIAITFTNKAAREMAQRVNKLLNQETARAVTVCTFHALGLRILQQQRKSGVFVGGFSLFDTQDSMRLVQDLLPKGTKRDLVSQYRNQISLWKNQDLSPDQVAAAGGSQHSQIGADIYADYETKLSSFRAVDFDDLILKPLALFRSDPEVLRDWQQKVGHLLVDEYQDTNASQYQLVRFLTGDRAHFTVVGDDDQSVYAWRGAQPENLNLLARDFPPLKVIKLEQNYRCSGNVLKAANGLIAHNKHLFEKKLWSSLPEGDVVKIRACANPEDEARFVAEQILHRRLIHKHQFSEFAVLYRGNFQSRVLEQQFRLQNVPYQITGGQSFFERAEIKDLLSYLRLISNPSDNAAFLRIANVPRRDIGSGTLEKLIQYANRAKATLLDAALKSTTEATLGTRPARALLGFGSWIKNLADRSTRISPKDLVKALVSESNYESWLRSQNPDRRQASQRMQNVTEFVNWIAQQSESNPGMSLMEMVAQTMLQTTRDEPGDKGNQVSLMTLHSSKGLEFPFVHLVGLEEGTLPHQNSLDEGGLEEERRLLYVGITRAQSAVTLTFSREKRRYGEKIKCMPSRFLEELPEDSVRWQGKGIAAPKKLDQQETVNQIEGLLEMLNRDE